MAGPKDDEKGNTLGEGEKGAVEHKLELMTSYSDAAVALWHSANEPLPSECSKKCVSRREKLAGKAKGDAKADAKADAKPAKMRGSKKGKGQQKRTAKKGRSGNPQTTAVKQTMLKTFGNYWIAVEKLEDATAKKAALVDLFVMMMQVRNCRSSGAGKGARYPSRRLFILLAKKFPKTAVAMLELFPKFGYWKDLNEILLMVRGYEAEYCPAVRDKICSLYADQLLKDHSTATESRKRLTPDGEEISGGSTSLSLAAKWAPKREKTCARQTNACKMIGAKMFGQGTADLERKYEQLVTPLNKILKTPEISMSANEFSEIEFKRVCGRCLNRNRNLWLDKNADDERRHLGNPDRDACVTHFQKFLDDVTKGKASAKGQSVMVDTLVKQAMAVNPDQEDMKALLEGQWQSHEEGLRAKITEGSSLGGGMVLADVSASMDGAPMNLSIALAILISRLADEPWKNKFINFSSDPTFIDISSYTKFVDAVKFVKGTPWGGSTDFLKVFELILDLAKKNKLRNEQLPKWFIVVSDMQFDQAAQGKTWNTHHEILVERFREVGVETIGEPYKLPMMIYWNARANTKGSPVDSTQENAQMVSGYSAALVKLFLNDGDFSKVVTPFQTLRNALDSSDYDNVRKIVENVGEVSRSVIT